MIAVILAGGIGKRLWPIGRRSKPKQFQAFFGTRTLLQETYARLRSAGLNPEQIFISTNQKFVAHVKNQVPKIPRKNIIVEPKQFDTAFGMGFATQYLIKLGLKEKPCVFVPSDHFINNASAFAKTLKVIGELIAPKATGAQKKLNTPRKILVDIAVPPAFASTVLGYTKIGRRLKKMNGVEVYEFRGHTEKPNLQTARKYIKSRSYLWHANYYSATPGYFLELIKKYSPRITKPISFDYAVTEKINPRKVLILKAPFQWSDIGTWDEVWNRFPKKDGNKNVVEGAVVAQDVHRSIILGKGKRLVVVSGIRNMCIIDTPDALLIISKKMAQHSKKLIEKLEALDKFRVL